MEKIKGLQNAFLKFVKNNQYVNYPLKSRLFFTLLENIITKKSQVQIYINHFKQFSPLLKSFQKESHLQQIYFLLESAQIFKKWYENEVLQRQYFLPDIQTTCKIKSYTLSITTWDTKKFKSSFSQKRIHIIGKKSDQIINLYEYNARISRGQECSIVLQSLNQKVTNQKKKKITLKFKNHQILQQVYRKTKQVIAKVIIQRLKDQIKLKKLQTLIHNKYSAILSSEQIKKHSKIINQYKQKISAKPQDFQQIALIQKCKLFKSKVSKYQLKIEGQILHDLQFIKENITFGQNLIQQTVQIFQSNITAKLKKFQIQNKKYQMFCYCQQTGNQNQVFLSFSALQQFMIQNALKIVTILLKKIDLNKTKITVFCHFYQTISAEKLNFFLSLIKISQKQTHNATSLNKEGNSLKTSCKQIFVTAKQFVSQNFYTVHDFGDFNENQKQGDQIIKNQIAQDRIVTKVYQNQKSQKCCSDDISTTTQPKSSQLWNLKNDKNSNLRSRYQMNSKTPDKNYFIQNVIAERQKWKVNSNKQYQYEDKKLLTKRQQIYRQCLSKLPTNFFIHKSIEYYNFPLQLYQPQSLLVHLAQTLAYLPSILLNVATKSQVQKFKAIIVAMISMNLLKVQSKKIFFPFLGETFQGFLNGYPLYLQQIGQSPSLSAVLYEGLDYKVHGCIENTIQQGLNYQILSNRYPMTIEFTDNKIQFYNCQIKRNGIAFGDMMGNLMGKSCFLDIKNNIYAEIYFQKGQYNTKALNRSQFSGIIYQANEQLVEMLKIQEEQTFTTYLKKCQQISKFNGLWHSFINFDQKQYFNFNQLKIHNVQKEKQSLCSDSQNRPDIHFLRRKQYQECNKNSKNMLAQRKIDKKLRKKWKNKKKQEDNWELNSP